MKKLTIALITTSTISQASASIETGFYLGANIISNSFDAKLSWEHVNTTGPLKANSKSDLGSGGINAGVFTGYGILCGSLYYAGELGYEFNTIKPRHSVNLVIINKSMAAKAKNPHIFSFSVLGGWRIHPYAMIYARLGGSVSEVDMKANIYGITVNKKETRVAFVPGLGMQISLNKNWLTRLDYSHPFCEGVHKKRTLGTSTSSASIKNVNFHTVKFGLAYKV